MGAGGEVNIRSGVFDWQAGWLAKRRKTEELCVPYPFWLRADRWQDCAVGQSVGEWCPSGVDAALFGSRAQPLRQSVDLIG
jgi:hypothetical protein